MSQVSLMPSEQRGGQEITTRANGMIVVDLVSPMLGLVGEACLNPVSKIGGCAILSTEFFANSSTIPSPSSRPQQARVTRIFAKFARAKALGGTWSQFKVSPTSNGCEIKQCHKESILPILQASRLRMMMLTLERATKILQIQQGMSQVSLMPSEQRGGQEITTRANGMIVVDLVSPMLDLVGEACLNPVSKIGGCATLSTEFFANARHACRRRQNEA